VVLVLSSPPFLIGLTLLVVPASASSGVAIRDFDWPREDLAGRVGAEVEICARVFLVGVRAV